MFPSFAQSQEIFITLAVTSLTTFYILTCNFYFNFNFYFLTMAAQIHLNERRAYLRLAREIVANRVANLNDHDAKYKEQRKKMLLIICLLAGRPQHQLRRRRLLIRLGEVSKVTFILSLSYCLFVKKCVC